MRGGKKHALTNYFSDVTSSYVLCCELSILSARRILSYMNGEGEVKTGASR